VLKAAYDSMLKNKDKIRIYTIDSFFKCYFINWSVPIIKSIR
ncbi:hypothetical protein FSEG_02252, partial [Fusobacterium necrophorum D12]